MSEHTLHYGNISWTMPVADKNLAAVLESNPVSLPVMEPDQAVREALRHPIGSPCLKDIVNPGEKICLLVPDVTRLWQSPAVYVHVMVEELNACGIPDSDILIVTATGTHRAHMGDEQTRLLGEDICRRIRVIDHDCRDTAHLVHVGDTSRGTPVWFNSYAMACDKIIITCGVVYHFLAGFGGGGKMLLPGIAGYETIQRHHKQALNPGFGNGTNADVRSANMADTNIFHADIFEAAAMARPCFGLNVVVNDDYRIIKAFAGDWVQSHAAACRLVDSMEGVTIPERTPLVVASAGGYPKDINLYQTIKLLSNALSAVQPGGTMILLSRCSEGFGNPDVETQICAYSDMQAREKALRDTFSIGSYVGFLFAEAAEKHNLILVTDMDAALFGKTKMHVCHTLDEALDKARHFLGQELDVRTIIMPHGPSWRSSDHRLARISPVAAPVATWIPAGCAVCTRAVPSGRDRLSGNLLPGGDPFFMQKRGLRQGGKL